MTTLIISVIALIVASTALALWVYGRFHTAELRKSIVSVGESIDSLERTLNGLSTSAVVADQRLTALETRAAQIDQLKARQEDLENQQEFDHPYAHAIRLVRQGATVRRLMDELYLSETEAQLIVRLHGAARSA